MKHINIPNVGAVKVENWEEGMQLPVEWGGFTPQYYNDPVDISTTIDEGTKMNNEMQKKADDILVQLSEGNYALGNKLVKSTWSNELLIANNPLADRRFGSTSDGIVLDEDELQEVNRLSQLLVGQNKIQDGKNKQYFAVNALTKDDTETTGCDTAVSL